MKSAEGSTVIGKAITIRGEINGSEDLYIDGTVDGAITVQGGRLTIGPNGRVKANLRAHDVVIFGQVSGNVAADGSVDLRQSAALHGDISASRLAIEENATIKGRADLTGNKATATGAPAPAKA
jgi:cytoskeletal protein CcmA (bactofilin family)